MKKFNYIFILLLIGLVNCKKDLDITPPSIQIISPSQNTVYQVFQTIHVELIVEDDTKLEYVKLDVIDDNGGVAVNQVNRSGLSKKENLSVSLEILNIHLISGTYFIRIVASDGFNTKSEFIEIIIQETPLEIKKTFIYNQQTNTLDSLSIGGEPHIFIQFENNPVLIKSNSYYQESLIVFNNPSKLIYLKNENLENPIIFSVVNDQGNNFYTNIHLDPMTHHYFVSTNTGKIIEIGPNGTSYLTFDVTENHKPNQLTTINNLLFVEEKNTDFTPNAIKTYYKNSGILVNSHFINFDLVFMAPINENEILLIGNNSQGGVVSKYLIEENTIINYTEGLNTIYSACQINSLNYVIGFDQTLNKIELTNNSLTFTNNWSISSSDLEFNKVTGNINGVNNENFFNINLNSNQLTIIPLSNYNQIEFMYNK